MSWKTTESHVVLDSPFVTVRKNSVELDDGAMINDFYTVSIPDAVLVVALTEDDHILLKREFRYACRSDVIECPAGMVEKGETPEITARRELLEETGYASDDWTYLGPTWESTSKLTNTMHLFPAKGCKAVGEQKLDKIERIEVMKVRFDTAVDMVMDGRINANSSAHAILKVNNRCKQSVAPASQKDTGYQE